MCFNTGHKAQKPVHALYPYPAKHAPEPSQAASSAYSCFPFATALIIPLVRTILKLD